MKTIGIIGGGASGICFAYNVSKYAPEFKLILLEPQELASGLAFGNENEELILNVAAENMSIDCFDPHHFTDWLVSQGYEKGDFTYWPYVGRHLYRRYLLDIFKKLNIALIQDRALALNEVGSQVEILLNSSAISVDHVVIATGYKTPENSPDSRIQDCSQVKAKDIQPLDRILIIGSGLSAFDVFQVIRSQKFAHCDLISRRGIIPLPHIENISKINLSHLRSMNLREIVKVFRSLDGEPNWQSVADSFKEHISTIWPQFTVNEKKQFRRFLKPYWSAIRHRLPRGVWEDFHQDERFHMLKGKVVKIDKSGETLKVTLKIDGQLVEKQYDKVIMATGQTISRPFNDLPGKDLITGLGPVLHDEYWETNSIPDIREQILQFIKKIRDNLT